MIGACSHSDVSRETEGQLVEFWNFHRRWNKIRNISSRGELHDGFHRHVVDSVQIAPLLPPKALRCCDLGSGGGFPAVPLRLIRMDRDLDDEHNLTEADHRKVAFLHAANRKFGLRLVIHARRAEALTPIEADVVTARAVAPLVVLMPHLRRHLRRGGVAILHKGRRVADELKEAEKMWSFAASMIPSATSQDGVILCLTAIERKGRA